MNTQENHWLRDVAAHAGLDLQLPLKPGFGAIQRAWAAVAKASGVSDELLTHRVARHFRLGVADLSSWDPQAVGLVPEKVARTYGVLPLSLTDTTVVVATPDPANREARREIEANAGRLPVFLMASPNLLLSAIDLAYSPARSVQGALQTLVAEAAANEFTIVTTHGPGVVTNFELEAPAVVKLTTTVLQQAVRYGATEIFLEPSRESGRVRFRVDGVLQQFVDVPRPAHDRMVARLKNMAHRPPGSESIGLAGKRGFAMKSGGQDWEMLVHATPTPDGERLVVRIVAPDEVPKLADLGFGEPEGERIGDLLAQREGFVLVTGPTRSGKTWLIYAALNALAGRKLSTVSLENPVELQVPGVTQIPFDPGDGTSFAERLQQLMDQDPDVINAGEIRDLATARTVVRAAVTGRRVFATVHTSDALSGVSRLVDMGLAAGRVAESLAGVISLRLVRRLCPDCSLETEDAQQLAPRERKLGQAMRVIPARYAVGCPACGETGFRGQIPLAEVLVMTSRLRTLVADGTAGPELERELRGEGMRTFQEVGLDRVRSGETTLQEVERVVGLAPESATRSDPAGPVLVVDDEADDRLLIRAVLKQMGLETVEAEGGPQALRHLKAAQHDFSMVILDLFMPGMQGVEVLTRIRQSLSTEALPVLVLTASPNPRDEIELLDAGADDYLLKPIVADRLEARVKAALRRSGVQVGD